MENEQGREQEISSIYLIILYAKGREKAYLKTFPGKESGKMSGFTVDRETGNCWYTPAPPEGLPNRYRKADEYELINNGSGVYMFGTDEGELKKRWNAALAI